MRKSKITALLLSATLVCSNAMPVLAAEVRQTGEENVLETEKNRGGGIA